MGQRWPEAVHRQLPQLGESVPSFYCYQVSEAGLTDSLALPFFFFLIVSFRIDQRDRVPTTFLFHLMTLDSMRSFMELNSFVLHLFGFICRISEKKMQSYSRKEVKRLVLKPTRASPTLVSGGAV